MPTTATQTRDQAKQVNEAKVAATMARKAKAIEFSTILANDAAFVTEMSNQARRKDESKVSSAQCCLYIGGDLDPQQIMSLPDQGSDLDKYDTEDGKGRGSVMWDLASKLPDAIEVNQHLEWIKEAGKTGIQYSPDNPYVGKRKQALDDARTFYSGRKTAIKNNMGETVELAKRLLVANELEGIEVEIRTDEDDGTKVMPKTVQIIRLKDISGSKNADDNLRYMSVGSFLTLDVSKISEADRADKTKHYKAFVATGNRGKKGDGQGTKTDQSGATKYPEIGSIQDFDDWLSTGTNYLDVTTDKGMLHKALVLKMCADPKTGDDLIESLGRLCEATDWIWTVIQDRYSKLQAAKAAADKPIAKAS